MVKTCVFGLQINLQQSLKPAVSRVSISQALKQTLQGRPFRSSTARTCAVPVRGLTSMLPKAGLGASAACRSRGQQSLVCSSSSHLWHVVSLQVSLLRTRNDWLHSSLHDTQDSGAGGAAAPHLAVGGGVGDVGIQGRVQRVLISGLYHAGRQVSQACKEADASKAVRLMQPICEKRTSDTRSNSCSSIQAHGQKRAVRSRE